MRPFVILAFLVSTGCGSETAPANPGLDASTDAGTDAGRDSGADGSADAGIDSGSDPGASERLIFVTDSPQNANFGGISGADQLCASQAAAAGLEGEFKAWLSTISVSVSDRLTHSSSPYVLVDGTPVAGDWDDLVDGAILAPINLDASGRPQGGDVWTGTLATGSSYTNGDCAGFTSGSDGLGLCGTTGSTTDRWTANATPQCSTQLRLYCIEQ